MTGEQLAQKAINIAKNYKTSYIWGGLGRPITEANLQNAVEQYSKNKTYAPKARKYVGQTGAFFFDCVGLIKCILWGWNGDASKSRGGAVYGSNGVPDISADAMIKKCSGVSTDFSDVEIGEALWCAGHIGIYIGDGLGVECTPAWKNGVQITAVGNIGAKSGYNTRKWTKHGKLPYVTYGAPAKAPAKTEEKEPDYSLLMKQAADAKDYEAAAKYEQLRNEKIDRLNKAGKNPNGYKKTYAYQRYLGKVATKAVPPKSFDSSARKGVRLQVTASYLNFRSEPNADPSREFNIIKPLPKDTKVTWYGYHTNEFYYVQLADGTTGYVSRRYLRRL